MPIKYVVIREVKTTNNKNGEAYNYCLDQDSTRWNLFKPLPMVEPNKAYAFYFEPENGYNNLKQIQPVINVFKAQAIKETASKAEIHRNYSICMTQAIQTFAIGQVVPTNDELFRLATAIYTQVESFADSKMPKEN